MKKKIFVLFLFIVLLNILVSPKNKSLVTVFNEDLKTASSDDYKIYTVYTSTDNINTNNLKAILNNFNSKYINIMPYISDIYKDKIENQINYYQLDTTNYEISITRFIDNYLKVLKSNGLYKDINMVNVEGVKISKIEVFTSINELNKIINKYPNVTYN